LRTTTLLEIGATGCLRWGLTVMGTDDLKAKAAALGFTFERGVKKGAGYVLVDANGDRPLGTDYSASLADVKEYIDNFAADLGVDVEISDDKPSVPPPTHAQFQKSIREHANADQIKTVIREKKPPSTLQEQRDRIALDGLLSVGMSARSAMAFDKLSEAEKQKHFANVRDALAADEKRRAEAANLPTPTADDPLVQERARQTRVFQKANAALKTNIASLADYDTEDYREIAFENGLTTWDDVREMLREEAANFIPPEATDHPAQHAPTTSTGFAVQFARPRRLSKDEQRLAAIGAEIRSRKAAGASSAEIGKLLTTAKDILGHGAFLPWLQRHLAMPARTAQVYMRTTLG
jgi:hypothetical protein